MKTFSDDSRNGGQTAQGTAGTVEFQTGQAVIVNIGKGIRGTYQSAPWGQEGFHVVTTANGGQLHVGKQFLTAATEEAR